MPSHPDRVNRNYICCYCRGSLVDGKHTSTRVKIAENVSYLIGCPKHPKSNPEVTMINKDYFWIDE